MFVFSGPRSAEVSKLYLISHVSPRKGVSRMETEKLVKTYTFPKPYWAEGS